MKPYSTSYSFTSKKARVNRNIESSPAEIWQGAPTPSPRNAAITWYHNLSAGQLWEEIAHPDNKNVAIVTFKRKELRRGYFEGRVLISIEEIDLTAKQLLDIPGIAVWEGMRDDDLPVMPDGNRYPALAITVANVTSLAAVMAQKTIESVEPLFRAMGGIGCSLDPYQNQAADGDLDGNKVPWTYYHMGITDAWKLYNHILPGHLIRIGVVDTGVFEFEHQLTEPICFNSLPNRLPARHLSVVNIAWDDCGHGTRLAGLAAAPLDGQNIYPKKIVGVAWGAGLTTIKYNNGVVAGAGSRFDLVRAINLAVQDGAQIVNLALGMTYGSVLVHDCILTHYNTSNAIFAAAAGTFVSFVQFPAVMPEVVAVGIVRSKNPANPNAGYEKYGGLLPDSAYGEEVDIVAISGDGDVPTTGGENRIVSVGGSSSGTAHISGMLALVWGKYPNATRSEILSRLFSSCSLRLIDGESADEIRSGTIGYGIPNAVAAINSTDEGFTSDTGPSNTCSARKLAQDAARNRDLEAKLGACEDNYTKAMANCSTDDNQRRNSCNAIQCNEFTNCDSIQCNDFTNCDSIQCNDFTNCNDYWKTDPRFYACFAARGVCIAAAAVARVACWTARGACVAVAAVARVACWIARGVCVAAAAVARGACLAGSAALLAVCQGAAWTVREACKLAARTTEFVLGTIDYLNFIGCKINQFFNPRNRVNDQLPDFTGINFNGTDSEGNIIPFLWGASTSSFQVEGGIKNNDWHHFTHTSSIKDRISKLGGVGGTTLRLEPAGRAVDHWDLDVLQEDLDRAQLLGLNAYRFSLEWARIQPNKPSWADQVITKQREARDAKMNASLERTIAQNFGPGSEYDERIRRAEEFEAKAEILLEEAKATMQVPFDEKDFEKEPVLHYVEMVKAMRKRGLEPILTLLHMTLPDWVLMPPQSYDIAGWGAAEDDRYWNSLRGWENEATVEAYRKLVHFVIPFFRDHVNYFITLNEPAATVTQVGYVAGVFPPGFLGSGNKGLEAYHNLINAHIVAYDEIKALSENKAKVGLSPWVGFARRAPQTLFSKIFGDNEAAKNQWHYAVNQYFLDAIVLGHRNQRIWRKDQPIITEEQTGKVDFIAPQYYRACDIYHAPGIALTAPYWGGMFKADLRYSKDYLAKYLWSDLGWTIYPGGLYQLLREFHERYSKPLLITENGIAEKQDRNRAAFTISHLQQVLKAIKEGVNVIGYIHWSLIDNFEWAFGYQSNAQFGLFNVDRTKDPRDYKMKSFPRHITEGAIAYQYIIENSNRIKNSNSQENPFDAVVAKFGTISSDGLEVSPPTQLAGALWKGYYEGRNNPAFMLYLSKLPNDNWLGMIFYFGSYRWVRLRNIKWNANNNTLIFDHYNNTNDKTILSHEAISERSNQSKKLKGNFRVGVGDYRRSWVAERVPNVGVWRTLGGEPSHVSINNFEGDFGSWNIKYIYGKPIWSPTGSSIRWNGSDLEFEVEELADIKDFIGKFGGDHLTGKFTLIGGGGGVMIEWNGEKLFDDIPF